MVEPHGRIVEGMVFECTPGKQPCEECAKLNGKKWYHEPGQGQESMDDLPTMPVHFNCRCELRLVVNYLEILYEMMPPNFGQQANFSAPNLSPYFNTGKIGLYGMVVGSDDSPIPDGGKIGNHTGYRWTHGRYEEKIQEMADEEDVTVQEWINQNYLAPTDSSDRLAMNHDDCYRADLAQDFFSDQKLACDRVLVNGQRSLDDNPKRWEEPLEDGPYSTLTLRGIDKSIKFFEGKLDYAALRELCGVEYMREKYPLLYRIFERD